MVDWETWMDAPGLAPFSEGERIKYLDFTTKDSEDAFGAAQAYADAKGASLGKDYMKFSTWYPNKQVLFVNKLHDLADADMITIKTLEAIDMDLNITNTIQPEVMQRWFPLGIRLHYDPVFAPAKHFISEQGRMKYLNPIYQSLVQHGFRQMAFNWYMENESFYHPIARATLKNILMMILTEMDVEALVLHNNIKQFMRE